MKWLLWCFACMCLAAVGGQRILAEGCACDSEQTVHFQLRGVGMMAGTATVRVTWGNRIVETRLSGGTVVWNETTQRYDVNHYDCAQWVEEIAVDPKLNQPVLIEHLYDTNPASPNYTEFEDVGGPNPMTYWTRPSSPCLKIWFALEDTNWVPASQFFSFTNVVWMKGVIETDDSNIGDSNGPTPGGDAPKPNIPELTNAPAVGDLSTNCPGQTLSALAQNTAVSSASTEAHTAIGPGKSPKFPTDRDFRNQNHSARSRGASPAIGEDPGAHSIRKGSGLALRQPRLTDFRPSPKMSKADAIQSQSGAQGPTAEELVSPQVLTGTNGYSLADQIGRLRWEMSLGTTGRTLGLGKLIYKADVLDAGAYSPGRLRLSEGGETPLVITDTNGYLRQVRLNENLVDVSSSTNGFQVAVFPSAQLGPRDLLTGLFQTNGSPGLIWAVENPDPTPSGRVRFTRTQGTNSEMHEAQWQGNAGVSGMMTILRFGGKLKEEREYSLNSNQRIETISSYKNGVLQHKQRDVYQEFYNWGAPGDIYEALVQQVEDPDGKALTTTYQYWDQSSQPANELAQATYADGYSEQIPNRLSGEGFYPVVPSGGVLRRRLPYLNYLNIKRTDTYYTQLSGQMLLEQDETFIETTQGDAMLGYRETIHDFSHEGYWVKGIYDYASESGPATYEEEWLDLTTRKPVLTIDRNGTMRSFYYDFGYWNSVAKSFGYSANPGTVQAFKTVAIRGTIGSPDGIASKTTVDVTIEDQFGHLVLEESYVSDGAAGTSLDHLIDRKTHTYADGRLTATHSNGRLVYEARYYSDGLIEWQEDESGRRTEYTYDEMKRVHQKTIRGRGGDADQVITYEYDVQDAILSETRTAGALSVESRSMYDLAGELIATVGIDGLTNSIDITPDANGSKVVTETLPTLATRITRYYKDRQVRSFTGTAVEDEYRLPSLILWPTGFYREAQSVYRDSAETQLKQSWVVDWLGNEIKRQTPRFQGTGTHDRYTDYDTYYDLNNILLTRGLVTRVSETGRATQLFTYDEMAQPMAQGLDLDTNGILEAGSADPMTVFDRAYTNQGGLWQHVTTAQRYLQDGSAIPALLQRTLSTVPAALTTNLVLSNLVERVGGGMTVSTISLDRATGDKTTTNNDLELGQVRIQVERDGLLRSETQPGIALPRTYGYTALGELEIVNDPVTGSTTNAYNAVTRRLLNVTDNLGRQTTYDYYPAGISNAGRIKGTKDAAGNWTYFDYTPAGQLFRQWGVNTYPIQQVYDEAGRMTNLMTFRTVSNTINWASSTWPNPPDGDSTQWIYDQPSGLLAQKLYADSKGVSYSYNSGNFLSSKTNGRGQTITYNLDITGRATNVFYSDGTPPVNMSYDRAGRLRSVADASGTRSISWSDRDQMGDETYTAGLLSGITVTRGYDSKFRLETLGLSQGGVAALRQRTTYDSISWVDYISDETPDGLTVLHKFDYAYKPNTPFVQTVDFYRGNNPVMTQSYTRDSLGRLAGAGTSLAGIGTLNGVNYQFDSLNRRFEAGLADGSKWNYGYNERSEATSGKRQLASGAYAGGEQFEYDYDDMGNRTATRTGGDGAGARLRLADYSRNALNQYASRDVPGSTWLVGTAPTNLAVQGIADGAEFSVERQDGEGFFGEALVDNTHGAAYARITVAGKTNGVLNDVETGHRFVPKTPEGFAYDDDGNLTQDGRWIYKWDAENRLVSVTARTDIPGAAKRKVEFIYDSLGRRVQKRAYNWNASSLSYQLLKEQRFASDGWNLIAVLDSHASLLQSFVWGLDLSGTRQGAGGVGGLLSLTAYSATNVGSYYYSFDGNGNVLALVDSAVGTVVADYEHGTFGELLRAIGPMAEANPFRFSTKYRDDETDLLYYGYRYYDPSTGRWLSRDPLKEKGGLNLYSFVNNQPTSRADALGLVWYFPWTWGDPGPGDNVLVLPNGDWYSPPLPPALFQSLGDGFLDDIDRQIAALEDRSVSTVAGGIHDSAMFLLTLTPQNTFSEVFLGEDLDGQHIGVGGRFKCAVLSGPGITYLGGKAWKISGALLKRLRGKSAREIEEVLRKECCAAAEANPTAKKPPYSQHVKGQAAENVGWEDAVKNRNHVPIRGPQAVTAPGVDYITFDPASGTIFVWDAKYRGPGQWAPSSVPKPTLQRWMPEITEAVKAMPEGPGKVDALRALAESKIQGAVFKWP